MAAEAALARVRGRCELVLDTTYCERRYAFPPQPQARRARSPDPNPTLPGQGPRAWRARGRPDLLWKACVHCS
jgi:hypothetical protein